MLVLYDTETTGLVKHPDAPPDKQPRIIEFGAVAISLKNGKVIDRLSQLINPGHKLDSDIQKITGISNVDLADQPGFLEAWMDTISPFIKRATVMLAHNEPFDRQMVDHEMRRVKLAPFKWPATFCTISLYRERWGRDMKLTELYANVMGTELDQKHRAASDVDALVEIIQKDKLWKVLS